MNPQRLYLNYHIICTIDVFKGQDISLKNIKCSLFRKLRVTETEVEEPEYYSKHRKYCGLLSPKETVKFINEMGFYSTCQTMGALTLEYGMLDAISFDDDSDAYRVNAYISPIFTESTDQYLESELMPVKETMPEQFKIICERIYKKTGLALDMLKNFFKNDGHIAKSFRVDLWQLSLILEA